MAKEDGAESISDQLEAAIDEDLDTSESPTEETESAESEERGTKGKQSNAVPYSRFKEVNDARREMEEAYGELEQEHRRVSASLREFTDLVNEAKEDRAILQEIKALANDPNMRPHIEAIDRRLKGLEEEIENLDEAEGNKVLEKTRQILEREQRKVSEQLSDQQMDIITNRADSIAEKWLDALPEEYTDTDRQIISRLWADEMDEHWDTLSEDPSRLHEALKETFQETINAFGEPRGGLIDPDDPDSYEIEYEETPEVDPAEELLETIRGKNYDVFKEGKAEVSDDEFAADMAKVIRMNRS